MFKSQFEVCGQTQFPAFTGLRIMHMPFLTRDVQSLRGVADWYMPMVADLCRDAPDGVGYLTIDEACLNAGEFHRRPGLHVDGVDENGEDGGWGGGGGWSSKGMLTASTHIGCRVYGQSSMALRKPTATASTCATSATLLGTCLQESSTTAKA